MPPARTPPAPPRASRAHALAQAGDARILSSEACALVNAARLFGSVEVRESTEKGRYLVARRAIPAGSVCALYPLENLVRAHAGADIVGPATAYLIDVALAGERFLGLAAAALIREPARAKPPEGKEAGGKEAEEAGGEKATARDVVAHLANDRGADGRLAAGLLDATMDQYDAASALGNNIAPLGGDAAHVFRFEDGLVPVRSRAEFKERTEIGECCFAAFFTTRDVAAGEELGCACAAAGGLTRGGRYKYGKYWEPLMLSGLRERVDDALRCGTLTDVEEMLPALKEAMRRLDKAEDMQQIYAAVLKEWSAACANLGVTDLSDASTGAMCAVALACGVALLSKGATATEYSVDRFAETWLDRQGLLPSKRARGSPSADSTVLGSVDDDDDDKPWIAYVALDYEEDELAYLIDREAACRDMPCPPAPEAARAAEAAFRALMHSRPRGPVLRNAGLGDCAEWNALAPHLAILGQPAAGPQEWVDQYL